MSDPTENGAASSLPRSPAAWMRAELTTEPLLLVVTTLTAVAAAAIATFGSWLMIPIGMMLFPDASAFPTRGPAGLLRHVFGAISGSFTPGRLVLVLFITYVLKNAAEYAARLLSDLVALRTERRLRERVWRAIWTRLVPSSRGESRNPLPHALLVDAREAASGLALGPIRIVGDPLTALGYLFTMVWISPWLAVVLLAAAPLGVAVARRGLKTVSARASARAIGRVRLGVRLGELLRIAPVVRAHAAQPWALSEARSREQSAYRAEVIWTKRVRAIPSLAEVIGAGAGALVIGMGMREIAGGAVVGAEFLTFLTAFFLLLPVIKRLAALSGDVKTALSAWERLLERARPESGRGVRTVVIPRTCAPNIRLRGLTVRGPEERTPLGPIDLDIPAGALVAVVGPTGAGKSLLLEALAALILPAAGGVWWDKKLVLSPTVRAESSAVGYLPQEGWAIAGSVGQNISLGREAAREEMAELLHAVALDLPDGIDTVLGENGAPLSGGERQRIALARALLTGPPLLVLDEPSSALDDATEGVIVGLLLARRRTSTIVVATHRSAFVRHADVVVSLRDGKVVGTSSGDLSAARAHEGVLA